MILHTLDNNTSPEVCLTQRLAVWQQSTDRAAADLFAIQFVHHANYLPGKPQQVLLALVFIQSQDNHILPPAISVSIFPCTDERQHELAQLPDDMESVLRYCHQWQLPRVILSAPLLLSPVYIPKPWGQEIWYTGIEARGQAQVIGEEGSLPLPWVMEFLRHRLSLASEEQLILLKVLDPLADECYGDLYFELHEQKQEVYVVTHVNERAWPDGRGAIQLGFDPVIKARYETNAAFKSAYCAAVHDYENVRRAIDKVLDQKKHANGIALEQPVAASQLKLWINELAQSIEYKDLIAQEKMLKQAMERFVAHHSLVVGDVVAVPRLVPHALQHGVRVVEFQTPVYERKILSFGQKVLTQEHWDTVAAMELVDMDSALSLSPTLLCDTDGIQIQRIVNFDEFEVRRINLCGEYQLEFARYCLLMVLDGEVCVGSRFLVSGDVVVIAADASKMIRTPEASSCLFLQAIPRP